jgi:hypothetical protein
VLNAALLVPAMRAALQRRPQRIASKILTALGMIVSFSGPWAPYRFVELYGDA